MKTFSLIRAFLTLAVIVGPLPVTLTNDTTADATQVMKDLNWLMNQINANAAATTGTPSLAQLAASNGSSLIGFLQVGTGAVARTQQAKDSDIVAVTDFGAVGDWNGSTGTDNNTAIQAANAAVIANGRGSLFFPSWNQATGQYKITAKLATAITMGYVGEDGAGIYQDSVTDPVIELGTSLTVWNGNQGTVDNLILTGNAGGAATCHGVNIQAMLCSVRNVTGSGLQGSLVHGQYAQYAKIEHCGGANLGRYTIEILTADYSAALSGDVSIKDIYQCSNNTLGGIFFQGANSILERVTATADTGAVCTDALINLQGWNNKIDSGTLEVTTLTGKTMLKVTDVTFFGTNSLNTNTTFTSNASNTPILLATLTGLKLNDVLFNMSGGVPTAYVMRTDTEGTVTYAVNFNRCFKSGIEPWINARQNCWFESPVESYVQNIATTSGAFLYNSGPLSLLPCWGVWEITVRSGHTASMATNNGVQTFLAYYLPGIAAFEALGTFHGAGTISVSQIVTSGVASTGQVTVSTTSSANAVVTQVVTAKQIGFSE